MSTALYVSRVALTEAADQSAASVQAALASIEAAIKKATQP